MSEARNSKLFKNYVEHTSVPRKLLLPPIVLKNIPGRNDCFPKLARYVSTAGYVAEQKKFFAALKYTLGRANQDSLSEKQNVLTVRRSVQLSFLVKKNMEAAFFFALESAMEMAGFTRNENLFLPLTSSSYLFGSEKILYRGVAVCKFISNYPVLETISFLRKKRGVGVKKNFAYVTSKSNHLSSNDSSLKFTFRFHILPMQRGWYPINYQEFSFELFQEKNKKTKEITRVQCDVSFCINRSWLSPLLLHWFRGRMQRIVTSLEKLQAIPPREVWGADAPLKNMEWLSTFLSSFIGKGKTAWNTKSGNILSAEVRRIIDGFSGEGFKDVDDIDEKQIAMNKLALQFALLQPRVGDKGLSISSVLQDRVFTSLSPLNLMYFFKFQPSMSSFFDVLTSLSFFKDDKSTFNIMFGRLCSCGNLCEVSKNLFLLGVLPCSHCDASVAVLQGAKTVVWFELKASLERRPISHLMRTHLLQSRLQENGFVADVDNPFSITTFQHWFCTPNFLDEEVKKYFLLLCVKSKRTSLNTAVKELNTGKNLDELGNSTEIISKLSANRNHGKKVNEINISIDVFSVAIKITENVDKNFWKKNHLQDDLIKIAQKFNGRMYEYDFRRGAVFVFPLQRFAYGFLLHLMGVRNTMTLPTINAPGSTMWFFLFSGNGKLHWSMKNFYFSCLLLEEITFTSTSLAVFSLGGERISSKSRNNNTMFCVSEKLMQSLKKELNIHFKNGFTKWAEFATETFFCSEVR